MKVVRVSVRVVVPLNGGQVGVVGEIDNIDIL